jgi:hypothetical protein
VVLLAWVAAGPVAGCGVGDPGDEPFALTTLPPLPAPPGAALTVMMWAPLSGNAAYPDLRMVVDSFVRTVNANGGVNGRALSVMICDTRGDRAGAEACARAAVRHKVSAVVGRFAAPGEQTLPILAAAGIADIGPSRPTGDEFTDPMSFPILGGIAVQVIGAAHAAVTQNCRRITMLVPDTLSPARFARFARAGLSTGTGVLTEVAVLPAKPADPGPTVARTLPAGDCVLVIADDVTTEYVLSWVGQNRSQTRLFTLAGGYGAQYRDLASRIFLTDQLPAAGDEAWGEYRDALAQTPPGAVAVDPNGQVERATWAAFELFLQVGRHSITFDAASILRTLRQDNTLNTGGILPAMNFGLPGPLPTLPQLRNPYITTQQYINDRLIEIRPGFTDLTHPLATATR